jgi:hypothetical protein
MPTHHYFSADYDSAREKFNGACAFAGFYPGTED